jgi:hypothetical protein
MMNYLQVDDTGLAQLETPWDNGKELLLRWLCLCMGKMWDTCAEVQVAALQTYINDENPIDVIAPLLAAPMPEVTPTFREHSGNMRGTFREHEGNIHGTFREHSGNIQGTFREHQRREPHGHRGPAACRTHA